MYHFWIFWGWGIRMSDQLFLISLGEKGKALPTNENGCILLFEGWRKFGLYFFPQIFCISTSIILPWSLVAELIGGRTTSWKLYFFCQGLVATTWVPDLPFAGGRRRPKNLKNPKKRKRINYSYSHSHTFAHTLFSAPDAVTPDIVSAFWRHRSAFTQAFRQDPTVLAESHPRRPTPFCTASKVCLGPHLINHTILSVILLHSFWSLHTPFASSNPILLSAHAFLTPSIHLEGGLPLRLSPLTSDI